MGWCGIDADSHVFGRSKYRMVVPWTPGECWEEEEAGKGKPLWSLLAVHQNPPSTGVRPGMLISELDYVREKLLSIILKPLYFRVPFDRSLAI